ncbi:hypothetical protein F5Y13DRAFT_188498 [Hypoxylon sp. FL1857]|nr:hypothetical protein F5Y13DRAFT_188498 [Hypoxylon sp. FL1857]
MSNLIAPLSATRMETMGEARLRSLSGEPFLLHHAAPPLPFTCRCRLCYERYFPCSYRVSDGEAKRDTAALAMKVAEDYQYLREAVSKNAEAMLSRWKKKSREKRLELLNSIADLHPKQDALLHLFNIHSSDTEMEKLALKYTDTWFFPYLDSKTLSDSHVPMMALLHDRTKFSPPDWAIYDEKQLIYAKEEQVIPMQFNSHCIDFSTKHYGRLVAWDPDRAHQLEIIGYGKGLLVLTAQARLLGILRSFTENMVGEIGERSQHGQGGEGQCFLDRGNQGAKWQQLVSTNFTSPSVPRSPGTFPAALDPLELFDVMDSIYNAEADELYLMQTDPQYVQRIGAQLSLGDFPQQNLENGRWFLVASEVVTATALRKFWLEALRDLTLKLRASYKDFEEQNTEVSRLRRDSVLAQTSSACEQVLELHVYFIRNFMELSPAFNNMYEWVGVSGSFIGVRPRRALFKDKLGCILHCLYDDPRTSVHLNRDIYLNAFHREYQSASKQEQQRVGPTLMRLVGYASKLCDIRASLECVPGINRSTEPDMILKCGRDADLDSLSKSVAQKVKTLFTERQWPKGKHSTTWLDQARAARDALDQVWITFEKGALENCKAKGASKDFVNRVKESLSARNSEQYLQERKAEEESVQRVIEEEIRKRQERTRSKTKLQPPEPGFGFENRVSGLSENLKKAILAENSAKKKKTKTRGESSSPPLEEAQGEANTATTEEEPDEEQKRIAVKGAHMVLLEHMFPEPGRTRENSSFKWQLFVEIMVLAGFEPIQGHGSAVSFRHVNRMAGSIVIHQPHPEPTIDHIRLLTWGKRLRRWFGWNLDSFTVDDRVKVGEHGTQQS